MKTFREFVNEETMPFAQTEKGFVGIDSPAVRDNINSLLAGVTDCEFITPYIALERVAKVLANFHIFLPKQTFLDADQGMVTIEINQFGEKIGATDNGEVVTQASSPYYLYFEYEVDDNGTFEVFSEVVTEDELDEILSDMNEDEEELDEEKDSEEDDAKEDDEEEDKKSKIYEAVKKSYGDLKNACWKGYTAVGMKTKNGKKVPNCVPVDEAEGMHLDKPQKGKLASINKLNKEEALDEISKEKVNKYLDANEKSREKLASKSGLHGPNIKRTPENDKAEKKLMSRVKSRDLALAKKYPQYGGAKVNATEETLDELSKETLGSYVKKASHDVAAKSAAVRGFARDADAQRKDKKPMDARKSDERADKMFKKSWNRRQGMAKAVDKLTKEELSPADKGRVAAGYRGSVSNPAKQGAIAAYLDDQERDKKKQQKAKTPEKANFNVAKKLARQAVKAQKAKNK